MNIKHKELFIPENDPFANCKLGRIKSAEVLTTIVETYADGFVLAVNNKWGTGKTTFIKMWQQQLHNNQYKTLYFNAWENDFESSPLVAIMGELRTLTKGKKGDEKFKSLTKQAGIIAKNILPTLAFAVASKYIEIDNINELIKKATEAGVEILEDEIKRYSEKKNGLIEFREKLKEYIIELKSEKPIVFFIDELDRCRPNYAVEVLENIKHFFNVPNIIFILSIDKEQLCEAVRGVYGSENIDAQEYLRRFIDIEYQLPDPDTDSFCKYLYEYFEFEKFFKSESRNDVRGFQNDDYNFLRIATALFINGRLTLRQQEQIFSYARIVFNTFPKRAFVFPELTFLLIFFKITKKDLYSKIICKTLTIEQLNGELNEVLPNIIETGMRSEPFIFVQAELLYRYNLSIDPQNKNPITNKEPIEGKDIFTLMSKYDESTEGLYFKRAFVAIKKDFERGRATIDSILRKISLIDNIVS
jgi:hypothetical protein